MMCEEHSVEDMNEKGYRSLGNTFQGSVGNTVGAWRLVELETPDGFHGPRQGWLNRVRWQGSEITTSAPGQPSQ
jgi:hypothetical protein